MRRSSRRTNKWELWPIDAVQCMLGVVKVADPLVGLVWILRRLLERETLSDKKKIFGLVLRDENLV